MLLQNSPGSSTRPSLVFLLRVWPGNQPGETRFRLEEVATRQGMLFEDVQELADFLAQRVNEARADS